MWVVSELESSSEMIALPHKPQIEMIEYDPLIIMSTAIIINSTVGELYPHSSEKHNLNIHLRVQMIFQMWSDSDDQILHLRVLDIGWFTHSRCSGIVRYSNIAFHHITYSTTHALGALGSW
jgi:hypothetical protein